MIEQLGSLDIVNEVPTDTVWWVIKPYLSFWGLVNILSSGVVAFFMLLYAEDVGKEKPKKKPNK